MNGLLSSIISTSRRIRQRNSHQHQHQRQRQILPIINRLPPINNIVTPQITQPDPEPQIIPEPELNIELQPPQIHIQRQRVPLPQLSQQETQTESIYFNNNEPIFSVSIGTNEQNENVATISYNNSFESLVDPASFMMDEDYIYFSTIQYLADEANINITNDDDTKEKIISKVKSGKYKELKNEIINDTCPINLTEFSDNDNVSIFINCNHAILEEYLDDFALNCKKCPLCNSSFI